MPASVHRRTAALAILFLLAGVPAAAEDPPACASDEHPGGEWRTYGQDLANSRHQELEDTIGAAEAEGLEVAWVRASDGGDIFHATPVVADGCVYIGAGNIVYALNADTGETVWQTSLQGGPSTRGGNTVGSVSLAAGLVLVPVNLLSQPYVAALDQATGEQLWQIPVDDQKDSFTNASNVVYDGLLFAGFSVAAEREPPGRGGYAIIDIERGERIAHRYVISDADFTAGYAGASIWGTPAIDPQTGYAYVGTSNPHSTRYEHQLTNALLKIDLDRDRATFGDIVAAYKGQSDSYVDGLADQPACELLGDEITYGSGFSVTCVQLDVDFGASPNLFHDDRGGLMVGALQKSGVYHAVHAGTMTRAWQTALGAPCMVCNGATSAYDGNAIYVAAVPPGQMVALDPAKGGIVWAAPIGDGLHYNPVSVGGGVVYTVDGTGFLNMYEAQTGRVVAKRDLSADTGARMVDARASGGVAIAHNTLYAAATRYVIAYR
jgi:polyvinyl alcohol dehydrogenase (cytochrome)